MKRIIGLLVCLWFLPGCGSTKPASDAGGGFDAAPKADAGSMSGSSGPAREITSGALRVSGGQFVMDVQVGHPFKQAPSSNGTKTIEGGTAIRNP